MPPRKKKYVKSKEDFEHEIVIDEGAVVGIDSKSSSLSSQASSQFVNFEDKLQGDPIVNMANKHWNNNDAKFDPAVVELVYTSEIFNESSKTDRIQVLDISCYLELYLWKHFSSEASLAHVLSIVELVNQKFREGVNGSEMLLAGDKFSILFTKIVAIFRSNNTANWKQKSSILLFLINIFKCLESVTVRQSCLRYLSLPLWKNLSSHRLKYELQQNVQLSKHWEMLMNKENIKEQEDSNHKMEVQGEDEHGVTAQDAEEGSASGGRKRKSQGKVVSSKKSKGKAFVSNTSQNDDKATTGSSSSSAQYGYDAESLWVYDMVTEFLGTIEQIPDIDLNINIENTNTTHQMMYILRFYELLIDLLSQLSTRRFLNTLLDDMNVITRIRESVLYQKVFPIMSSTNTANNKSTSKSYQSYSLFIQLYNMLITIMKYEVNDLTGSQLTSSDIISSYNKRLHDLQTICYRYYKDEMKSIVFSSTGELGKESILRKHLSTMSDTQLYDIADKLGYIPLNTRGRQYVVETLIYKLAYKNNQIEALNQISLYPTESLLWDINVIPVGNCFDGGQVLALPKLNLQFLTLHDYLLRNFHLFRLESFYEIRQDITDALKRIGPRQSLSGTVSFGGWSRMALPISKISIDEVSKPLLGEVVPGVVRGSVEVDLERYRGEIRSEWESLREHDVIFLVCIQNPSMECSNQLKAFDGERKLVSKGMKPKTNFRDYQWVEDELNFPSTYGVKYIRGAVIYEVRDEENVVLNDFARPDDRKTGRSGHKRTLRVKFDSAQYYEDMRNGVQCYDSLNLVVRRKAKENNFRAVLETIRELMNSAASGLGSVPNWLHDVFLGYGNPNAANYRVLNATADKDGFHENMDYTDTFLDSAHLISSFPNAQLLVDEEEPVKDIESLCPPYRLRIKRDAESGDGTGKVCDHVYVSSYREKNLGPLMSPQRPKNAIRFTSTQIEGVRSGMNQGLTMIVGPPGTGKTDVAVQIICNLYHNFPTHKILVVSHSNSSLNDLFDKIMQCNVDARHLLRLGSGSSDLLKNGKTAIGTDDVFSKQGRVNWSLERRLYLLQQVQSIASSLNVIGDMGYTCEIAEYFYMEHVKPKLHQMNSSIQGLSSPNAQSISEIFPFTSYFTTMLGSEKTLFVGDYAKDLETARGCLNYIENMFQELSDYRAFELLRTQSHRADYLLIKQARIVAMTCTHAAMTRHRLVELDFKYDSLVMEEAGQILEVETLIPMLLQNVDTVDGSCRLKRVVLIGDHQQLPPVVKHPAFQRYSKFDQSMFSRFIRLGVPFIQLDKQGRARSDIAKLFSWKYHSTNASGDIALDNLPIISEREEYLTCNPGLLHSYQVVNVPAYQGKGEFCPTPFYYQNLGEAEYVVAMYQYMRLIGYPANKISILTTYNGQKHLIRDVIAQRCRNPIFGQPHTVTTVDKYQGQQNDYILLSLVRTDSTVGHLRDIRRLIVAVSRARLGLYIFCRQSLFQNCFELQPVFKQLCSRPTTLQLVKEEYYYACQRKHGDVVSREKVSTISDLTELGLLVYEMGKQVIETIKVHRAEQQLLMPVSQPNQMEVGASEVGKNEKDEDEDAGDDEEEGETNIVFEAVDESDVNAKAMDVDDEDAEYSSSDEDSS